MKKLMVLFGVAAAAYGAMKLFGGKEDEQTAQPAAYDAPGYEPQTPA